MDAALQRLRGVLEVRVDWHKGAALIRHTAAIAAGDLVQAVERASAATPHSYQARPEPLAEHSSGNEQVLKEG